MDLEVSEDNFQSPTPMGRKCENANITLTIHGTKGSQVWDPLAYKNKSWTSRGFLSPLQCLVHFIKMRNREKSGSSFRYKN